MTVSKHLVNNILNNFIIDETNLNRFHDPIPMLTADTFFKIPLPPLKQE